MKFKGRWYSAIFKSSAERCSKSCTVHNSKVKWIFQNQHSERHQPYIPGMYLRHRCTMVGHREAAIEILLWLGKDQLYLEQIKLLLQIWTYESNIFRDYPNYHFDSMHTSDPHRWCGPARYCLPMRTEHHRKILDPGVICEEDHRVCTGAMDFTNRLEIWQYILYMEELFRDVPYKFTYWTSPQRFSTSFHYKNIQYITRIKSWAHIIGKKWIYYKISRMIIRHVRYSRHDT